jgi:hypothetical protein
MPRIGNVEVSDDVLQSLQRPPAAGRPTLGAILGAATEGTVRQAAAALPYQFDTLTQDKVDPGREQQYQQGLNAAQQAFARAAPASVDDLTSRRVGFGRFVAENLVGSLPQMGATIAGGVAGGVLGGAPGAVVGATAAGAPLFSSSNVARAAEDGDLTVAEAERSAAVAPAQSAADFAVARFLPGMGKILGGTAATQTGGFLKRTAQAVAKAAGTEAVTEASQQLGERYAAGLPLNDVEAAAEYINAAVTGAAVGGALGVGGGFRRTAALAKEPDQVTDEDIMSHVDEILRLPAPADMIAGSDGQTRVNPSGTTQLALPAPEDPITPVDAAGRASGAIDPVVMANMPRTADMRAGGPALDLEDSASDVLASLGLAPNDAGLLQELGGDGRFALNQPEGFAPPREFQAPEAAPGVTIPPSRIFKDEPLADLTTALTAPDATPEIRAAAEAEIETRRAEALGEAELTTDNFQQRVDELKTGLRGGFVQKLAATDPADLRNQVYTEIFENASTAVNVQRFAQRVGLLDENLEPTPAATAIEAARLAEVQAEAQPGATPAAAVAPITQEPGAAPTAPVRSPAINIAPDPEQQAEVSAALKAAGIQRPGKLNELRTPGEVFNALADDRTTAKRAGDATPTEKVARKLGLITDDDAMDVTPKGRSVYLQTPRGREDVTAAAVQQGYAGDNAALFNDGVRAQMAGETQTEFSGVEQMVAYEAGKVWAKNFVERGDVQTAGATAQTQARDATRTTGTAVDRTAESAGGPRLSPDQIQSQSLNRLIDTLDLRTVRDTDIAELRRMVRAGAEPRVVEEAIVRVQGGQMLFRQPAPTQERAAPASTRIDAVDRNRRRRQKIMFEQMEQDRREAQRAKQASPRTANRAETETAVAAYDLRSLIQFALAEKGITKARAAKLHSLIDQGKVAQVRGALKDFTDDAAADTTVPAEIDGAADPASFAPQAKPPKSYRDYEAGKIKWNDMTAAAKEFFNGVQAEQNYQGLLENEPDLTREQYLQRKADGMKMARQFMSGAFSGLGGRTRAFQDSLLGAADPAFETAIADKDFNAVLDTMIEDAPSAYMRSVMQAVKGLATKLQRAGAKFEIQITKPGDTVPLQLTDDGIKALSEVFRNPAVSKIWLKGSEMGPQGGTNYQIAAHEMVHSVTQMAIDTYGAKVTPQSKGLERAVGDLVNLVGEIKEHLDARVEQALNAGVLDANAQLTPFEQAYLERTNNTLADVDEVLAWGLTNPEMQRYLATIQVAPRQSVWSKFVNLVKRLLQSGAEGVEIKEDSALAELLRVSERIFDASQPNVSLMMLQNNRFDREYGVLSAAAGEVGASAANRTAEASNSSMQEAAQKLSEAVSNIPRKDMARRTRKFGFGWFSQNHLDRVYGTEFEGQLERSDAKRSQAAVHGRWSEMGNEVNQRYEKLLRENEASAKRVSQAMSTATEFQLDPDKAFADHKHLGFTTDETGTIRPESGKEAEVASLQRLHGELVDMANKLKRGDGAGWKLFNEFRQLNEAQNFSHMAAQLHEKVSIDRELALGVKGATVNPTDTFMETDGLETAQQVRNWWEKALDQQVAAVTDFVREKKGEVATTGSDSDKRATTEYLSPIEEQLNAIVEGRRAMARSPYFHLGRSGEHFGSATIARNKDGTVDTEAQRKVAEALEAAGFTGARISPDNTRPRIALRFDTVDQTQTFRNLMDKLVEQELVEADSVKAGPRAQEDNLGTASGLPAFVRDYISRIKSSERFRIRDDMDPQTKAAIQAEQARAEQLAIDTWIESQPDNSISKVLVKRHTIAGYDPDMVKSFNHRFHVGAINLANLSASPKLNAAYLKMRAQVNQSLEGSNTDQAYLYSDLLNEMKRRDASNPVNEVADTFDKLRAYSHSYFLGLSPAYGMINMTQLGVVALPELAKQHGYSKSFHAMRKASPQAIAVLKAATAASAALGPRHAMDLTLTESALRKAGLSDDLRAFTMRMIAAGTLDIGSAARAYGQIAEGRGTTKTETYLKYASAIGLYTETFSRLTVAIAARNLHTGDLKSAVDYATKTVSNSMFDYQNWNTARQLGKQGFLGPVTPIVAQFMSYTVQITEKLYSEFSDAVGKQRSGETAAQAAERKAGARRFMLGHLTAVTALAGSLGLPFATVFATVIERLVDAVDDDEEPYDAVASWRGFLADVMGNEMAEVAARGLPRALGFDISQRAGEQNLMPFSEFFADRRPWKEAVEAHTGRSLGAVPSMVTNVVSGGGLIADGDVLGGMKEMLPVAFKGPIEVYRMTSEGYVDSRGTRLPVTPGASAFLWQLLGFNPAEKAEYGEARQDQQARRGDVTRRATQLRQQIIKAVRQGDRDTARELVAEAQTFDMENPAFAILDTLVESAQRQDATRLRAQQTQSPMGVAIDDIAGQRLTDYANVTYTR